MTIEVLHEKGCSNREIARKLGIDEKAVRYRLKRLAESAEDGRSGKAFRAEGLHRVIEHWLEVESPRGANLQALYEFLVGEHGYEGSYKSVQRYVRARFAKPKLRTRRRVETPPGAQSQTDWGEFRGVRVGGEAIDLHAFHLVLSYSRQEAIVWSERADTLAWLDVHNRAFERLGGVAACNRVDNVKTAISKGAGPWGTVNPAYRAYAKTLRFHVDAARPRQPQEKGKVERRILGHRTSFDPRREAWSSLGELQGWTDEQVERSSRRRRCPVTGTSVKEAWEEERPWLGRLPDLLPEPFDLVRQRWVGRDATMHFEGRAYSVPFTLAGRFVEVRGCARTVQVWSEGKRVAEHPRVERGSSTPMRFSATSWR